MATYYWVGGNGNWDASTTANWASSSGGAGNAGVPTSADNVIFNSLSNATAYAVTVGTNAVAADITIAGPLSGNVTITSGATAVINCYGSWSSTATGITFTTTTGAAINFLATTTGKTVSTNNVTLGTMAVTFNGVGGGWTLSTALNDGTGTITVTNGSFNTGNQTITAGIFSSSNSNTRSITLGSSSITLSVGAAWTFTTTTGLTFSAGTSTIICSGGSTVTFAGGGLTYYNVSFSGVGVANQTISGANTFNNLTFTSSTSAGNKNIILNNSQIVNGTLTLGAGGTATNRLNVIATTAGTQQTITAATLAAMSDVDFRDIIAAGASAPWSGTRIGNVGNNNSGITFTAAKTVYWNLVAGGTWQSATPGWATSSGGTPAVINFPLAQDTAVIDNTGLTTGNTITVSGSNIGTLNVTKTSAMTLAFGSSQVVISGSVTLQSATVVTGTNGWLFYNTSGTSTFTTNGSILPVNLALQKGTLQFGTAATTTAIFTLTAGTLSLVSYTLTANIFSSLTTNTRSIAFGTGNITLIGSGTTVWSCQTLTGFTYTGTPTVNLTYSGSTGTRTIRHGNLANGNETTALSFNVSAGSDIVQLSLDANRSFFKDLNFTGFTGTLTNLPATVYGNLTFVSGMTLLGGTYGFTFAATSGTQQITTANKTLDFTLTFNGIGGTFAFQDSLTQGSTRAFTVTDGTVQLKAGTTNTVGSFVTSGTNQKYLQSTTAGTQATLSRASGTTTASLLTIKDVLATGGAKWTAYFSNGNIDNGNNSGWDFGYQRSIFQPIFKRVFQNVFS